MPESEMTRFLFLLPDPSGKRLLLCVEDASLSLPGAEVPEGADLLDVGLLNGALKAQLGVSATTLNSMHAYGKPEKPFVVFILENHSPGWKPTGEFGWFDAEAARSGRFASALQKAAVETWFMERERAVPALLPWFERGWIEQASDWIEAQLGAMGLSRTAPIEQRKSWYLSSVLRVPTTGGSLYFKAVPPFSRQEIPLARKLLEWVPKQTPQVLAIEQERRWMLTWDMAGQSLEQARTREDWAAALRDYALFQQRTTPHVEELLEMGCSDLRLSRLSQRSEELTQILPGLLEGLPEHLNGVEIEQLQAALPKLRDLCARASRYAVPETLVHGDFHGMNVFRAGGKTLFFDWSDACVSHPFFDAMELLDSDDWLPPVENAYVSLRDAYLQPWTAYAPQAELLKIWRCLKPLWALAMTFRHVRALEGMEAVCPLESRLPHSYALWATRQQQYSLAVQVRSLLSML